MNLTYFWSRARLAINKNTNISRYQTTNLLKIWFLFFVSMIVQNRNKSDLWLRLLRLFSCKNVVKFLVKSLLHSVFSQITENTKPRQLCTQILANPRQLRVHWFKSFLTASIIFGDFQNFLIYMAKYLITFKFS